MRRRDVPVLIMNAVEQMSRQVMDALKAYVTKYVEKKVALRLNEAEDMIRSLNRRVKALEDERGER